MNKYYDTIQTSRGDVLPNYRAQVVTSAGASVDIYQDDSGTRFTDSEGNVVNYATANELGRVRFYWTAADGQVLQILDVNGDLVEAEADFADNFVLGNLSGEIAQSAVTDLVDDLAAKADTSAVTPKLDSADLAASDGTSLIGMPNGGSLDDYLYYITPEAFGAVGDGSVASNGAISGTDDTTAIQDAIDYAVANDLPVRLLGKKYRTTDDLVIPDEVAIYGVGANNEKSYSSGIFAPLSGSWFLFDHAGTGLYCRDDAAVGDPAHFCRFKGFGTYRHQPEPTSGWTPTVCEPDILVESRVDLEDIILHNPYIGVKVRSSGVLQVTGVLRGQPLYRGIEIERSTDINNISAIHFWPFWTQEPDVVNWQIDNASSVYVTRCDGLKIDRLFSYGYKWTLEHVDATGAGSGMAAFNIGSVYCDKTGGGVRIATNYYSSYGTFGDINVNGDSAFSGAGAGLEISGSVASKIRVNGFNVTRAHEEAVSVTGAAHILDISPLKIESWDRVSGSNYAFLADNGATINLRTTPSFAGGNALFYSEGSSGLIFHATAAENNRSLVNARGFSSVRAAIADDGVLAIPVPALDKTVVLQVTPASVPGAGNPAGTYWLRCTASPSGLLVGATHTSNIDVGTGVLTGTTGTDGNLRINAANDGNIYVENRTGVARSFTFTMFGS